MGENSTPRQVSRNSVDGTTLVTSGISGNYNPDPSVISVISAAPPSGGLCSPRIGNIWQSTSPNFRKFDEFNAAVNRNFSNDLIFSPVINQVFCENSLIVPAGISIRAVGWTSQQSLLIL